MYIIVAGAGMIGTRITQMLVSNKHDVVVIDLEAQTCESVYTETGAVTIHGSATNISILEKAGSNKADAIITLMGDDADNISCALLAKSLKIPRIIARMRNPLYEAAYKLAGVTTIVRAADLLLNQIMSEIEQTRVKQIMSIGGGKAHIYALQISAGSKAIGMQIKEITKREDFPTTCVFMGIYRQRNDDFMIPRGNNKLDANDTVFLISTSQYIQKAVDFLTR